MSDEYEKLQQQVNLLQQRLAVVESGKGALSPNIENGIYQCDRDPGNWTLWGENILTILEARCLDNGEGTSWPHGPYGHVYIDMFAVPDDLDSIPDGADQRRLGPPMRLRGPWRTHDGLDEWLDFDEVTYGQGGIFPWDSADELVLRIFESDQSEDGAFGRRNDILGFEKIIRFDTVDQTLTASCNLFTNDHPRLRISDRVAFELKLATRDFTFPSDEVERLDLDSQSGNAIFAENLEPRGQYGIEISGTFRFSNNGKFQDAVYRQRRPGNWDRAEPEREKAVHIQGRLPWNEDVPPPFSDSHNYRLVAVADDAGRMNFRLVDNDYHDNEGRLEISIYGPITHH